MNLGADRKKLGFLGGLVCVGAYLFYTNVISGPDTGPRESRPASATAKTAVTAPAGKTTVRRKAASSGRGTVQEFRASMRRRPEDTADLSTIDPTLKLYLLAKVQAVEREGGSRNLFQFSTAPAPPVPKAPDPGKIIPKGSEVAQQAVKPVDATPPPTPINLKFYGYSTLKQGGRKRAFFLDGDDILVVEEGDVVKRRYRLIRIGINSVIMEDTESKSRQTLPLQEQVG